MSVPVDSPVDTSEYAKKAQMPSDEVQKADAPSPTPSGQLTIHFLDVGQGDAVLISSHLNDALNVAKLTYGQVSFMLTGDAEEASKGQILLLSRCNQPARS